MPLKQGPGFPLTRKGRGFSETLLLVVAVSLLATWLGLDSVEFWQWFDRFNNVVPITFS